MAKTTEQTVDSIIRAAIDGVVQRAAASIQRVIAAEVEAARRSAAKNTRLGRVSVKARKTRRPARREMTKWVADRNARRVPTFVIEATGLETKKKIVAKFGENAAFEKGKPLPASVNASRPTAASPSGASMKPVLAKAPFVRKKTAAAQR